jgi:hypothetical protein
MTSKALTKKQVAKTRLEKEYKDQVKEATDSALSADVIAIIHANNEYELRHDKSKSLPVSYAERLALDKQFKSINPSKAKQ